MTETDVLRLTRPLWNRISRHAAGDYPAECCGVLTEMEEGDGAVHPCRNIQDKLHDQDPEAHPRTSKTAYRMDDLEVHRILSGTEAASGKLRAFYHSHIDCEAYFSEEDHNAALFMGEPAYPGVVYLVVSVYGGEVKGQKVFRWRAPSESFEEVPLDLED